jgi:hypothetical protein
MLYSLTRQSDKEYAESLGERYHETLKLANAIFFICAFCPAIFYNCYIPP